MRPTSVDRRDFLLLRTRGRARVLELSCERLYMRWANARSGAGAAPTEQPAATGEAWEGEPPTEVEVESAAHLLSELEHKLTAVDVLVVRGAEWLNDPDFGEAVEALTEAFRARGGRVE